MVDTITTFFIMSQDSCAPNYNLSLSAEVFEVTGVDLYLIIDTINATVGSVFTDPGSVLNLGDTLPIPSTDSVSGSYKFFFSGGAGDYLSIRLMAEGVPSILGESYPCDSLSVVETLVTCQSASMAQFSANCTVDCGPPPVAGFKNKISATGSSFLVNFIDTSSYASSWFWDFNDGTTATTQNTSHEYADSGIYNVCLAISHPCGVDTICTGVTAYCERPVANFDAIISFSGATFFDSSEAASSWIWDFGDGNQSTLQNPVNNYASNGTYTVCLIVANTCGLDTICSDIIINCLFPTAWFTSDTVESNSYTVSFTNQSNNETLYFWDFGEGGTSIEENPVYTFPILSVSATYEVCLAAGNACGPDTFCQSIFIPAPIGIKDVSMAQQIFNIIPNPFSSSATIELPVNLKLDHAIMEIYNSVGRLLQVYTLIDESDMVLNAEQLTSGFYTFRIKTSKGLLYLGKACVIR